MEMPRLTETRVATCGRWLQRNWVLSTFVCFMLILTGCAGCQKWKYLPETRAEERSVYVVGHGWHTGIVLSREDLGQELGFLKEYLHQGQYYEFGWGEAEFYQAGKVTAPVLLKAVLWRNPSVMHVVSIPETPQKYFSGSDVVELNLSERGLEHLKDALRASFKFDQSNRPLPLKKGLYGESRFFKARSYYVITNTCNKWTANMLDSGGVPMDTVFTLRAASVIRQAKDAQERYLMLRPFGRPVQEGVGSP